MKCFNCDGDGHLAWQCGTTYGITPERPDPLALYRRAPSEISQRYSVWADQIRAEMGWVKGESSISGRKSLAELAAEQVSEARSARLI